MRTYQMCARCVMDTSDPSIEFDQGVCNHCRNYLKYVMQFVHPAQLSQTLNKLTTGKCIIGMSGGVDSSYVAYLLGKRGITPHVVTLDNGYNAKIADENVQAILKHFGWKINVHRVDFKDFAKMQLAYMNSGVLNIESISDHAIVALMWNTAHQIGAKFIVSGANYATEGILPKAWSHNGSDITNIIAILKGNGMEQMPKSYPILLPKVWAGYRKHIEQVDLLNSIPYSAAKSKQELMAIGWKDYGLKHWESIITRFYQRYILPTRAGIDKRKNHLSCLIMNGEMTRAQVLAELEKPLYTPEQFKQDRNFVADYLRISETELESLIRKPVTDYKEYAYLDYYQAPKNLREKLTESLGRMLGR